MVFTIRRCSCMRSCRTPFFLTVNVCSHWKPKFDQIILQSIIIVQALYFICSISIFKGFESITISFHGLYTICTKIDHLEYNTINKEVITRVVMSIHIWKWNFLHPSTCQNQWGFVYQTYVIIATMKTKMTMLNPMRMICNGF